MTRDEILDLASFYRGKIQKLSLHGTKTTFRHLYDMLSEMIFFPKDSKGHEKLNRWLGFMQGVLWLERVFTLDELRDHNKHGI